MMDIIVLLIIAAIVAAAVTKIVIEKKKGAHCVGCPTSPKSSTSKSVKASSNTDCGCGTDS